MGRERPSSVAFIPHNADAIQRHGRPLLSSALIQRHYFGLIKNLERKKLISFRNVLFRKFYHAQLIEACTLFPLTSPAFQPRFITPMLRDTFGAIDYPPPSALRPRLSFSLLRELPSASSFVGYNVAIALLMPNEAVKRRGYLYLQLAPLRMSPVARFSFDVILPFSRDYFIRYCRLLRYVA